MREYLVPVVFRSATELIVKEENQAEAIKKTREIIKNNERANLFYDNFKILETDIICLEDDKIMNEEVNIPSENMDILEFFKKFDKDYKDDITSNNYYNCVNGSDMLWIINEKLINGISSMSLNGDRKELSFDVFISNKITEINNLLLNSKSSKIIQVFINKHGTNLYRSFTNVKFLYKTSIQNINDSDLKERYIFCYDTEIPFSTFDCTVKELIKNA